MVMLLVALSYGLISLTLYSAAFKEAKLESLARIMACGTAFSLSLSNLL